MRKKDLVIREKVLNYLKAECLKEGGIIERSYRDIAESIGVNPRNGERIMQIVESLQRSGNIVIYPGKGNKANKYEYIKEDMKIEENIYSINLEESVNKMVDNLKDITSFCKYLINKNKELTVNMKQIEVIFKDIQHVGSTPQGHFFMTKHPEAVNMLIKEVNDKEKKGQSYLFGREEGEEEINISSKEEKEIEE